VSSWCGGPRPPGSTCARGSRCASTEAGPAPPRDRLFEILGWERGEFDLYPGELASGDDFGERAANLLILWAHQKDEAVR
jgi:hypothetical protein